ncbi:MAG: type I restriction-modification system subunit M N-terminal domain-containing protein [Luteolibacter sp.]
MPHTSSQTFLRELDKKLWTAADRLRSNLDAAVYKHAVLGLIFLKYISDSFAQRQAEIAMGVPPSGSASLARLADRQIAPERGSSVRSYKITSIGKLIDDALEAIEKENSKLKGVLETVASVYDRRTIPFRGTRFPHRSRSKETSDSRRPPLHAQIDPANLSSLIDLIASIPFHQPDLHAKDILADSDESSNDQLALR